MSDQGILGFVERAARADDLPHKSIESSEVNIGMGVIALQVFFEGQVIAKKKNGLVRTREPTGFLERHKRLSSSGRSMNGRVPLFIEVMNYASRSRVS